MGKKINFELIKTNLKLILIPVVVVLLLGAILIYFAINGQPKIVATYEQVWAAVENQGIVPTDTTEMFKEKLKENNDSKGEHLQKALTFINPDSGINFNFFIFDDDKSAHAARVSYYHYVRYDSDRFGSRTTNQEYSSSASNYTVYWVKHDNYYTVCTRVGNTVIYALEKLVLRKYPAEIKELNERIAGYEQDSTHLAEHPKPAEGIAPMVLGGVIYTERENAGKAIIEACTHMNGAETVSIGSYRGFSMLLSYDGAANEFRMVLKGKLSHTAVLGADAGGNVTRIDNALEKITEHLANARSQLAHTTEQLENARTEMTAPFPKEAELAEKTRRLNELNVLLNLNEQDRPVMADEPDEGDRIRPKAAERAR